VTAKQELKDPLGWIVAATVGGVGAAVLAPALGGVAIAAGIGIGAAVLGTKVAIGSRQTPSKRSLPRDVDLPKPPRGSPQAQLLRRADKALTRLQDLTDRSGDEWIHQRIGTVDDQAADVVDSMQELAGRVTVLQRSIASANPDLLDEEAKRLTWQLQNAQDPTLRDEREKTLQAVTGQVESIKRLISLDKTLLSRMHAAAVGLEGLATRAGELVAMGADTVNQERAEQVLGELTSDLDTMREGLEQAEASARRLE
jgi:hypothetical protein